MSSIIRESRWRPRWRLRLRPMAQASGFADRRPRTDQGAWKSTCRYFAREHAAGPAMARMRSAWNDRRSGSDVVDDRLVGCSTRPMTHDDLDEIHGASRRGGQLHAEVGSEIGRLSCCRGQTTEAPGTCRTAGCASLDGARAT